MKTITISEVEDYDGEEVTIKGWLYNRRSSGGIQFIQIRDGTGIIQGVLKEDSVGNELFEKTLDLKRESSLLVRGTVKEDERAPIGYELEVSGVEVQHSVQDDFPITPKEHGPGFLMDNRHLWIRAKGAAPVLRIRHELLQALRDFFDEKGLVATEGPILTGVSVEGTTTLFETDYFGEEAYLTQSSQLYLEATAAALDEVYWIGPVFRAEKSKTRKHLTEFWMAEAELSWVEHEENLDFQEDMVHYVVKRVANERWDELTRLDVAPESLIEMVEKPFPRITYKEAVEIVNEAGEEMEYGEDFGAPAEAALGDHFKKPVFIEAFPRELKPFYMEPMPGDERVYAADLIAPDGYGELIGGSQRIDDLDLLKQRLDEEGLPHEPYEWYLDLRRYGSVPHSGFGLGVERTIAWICGLDHVRETIPFPRQINRIYP
ncbi:MAG: asparagine--tRNA ligase [Candidatus Bipolaricaulota bacterium]|nr:asparagine--tRNA ligase [Candidatus Bipolaricaulota bacterium]MBS3791492.1 asparagine--tRNA ligase [Candidatus Bipolaricaulota bacterium]